MDSNSAVIACGGSRRMYKIVHLAVKKGNILVIVLLLKILIGN